MSADNRSDANFSDILIVGGGGAGMCAALEANNLGLSCTLLEADDKLGGSTYLSSGIYCAAGSEIQKRRGINDSPDALYEYIMTLSQWRHRPEIVRVLCDQALDGLDFLMQCGVKFPDEALCGGGRIRVARGHFPEGMGRAIVERLEERVNETPITVKLGVRAQTLIMEDGRAAGVKAMDGTIYRSSAVILTTGGFSNNLEMVQRLFPSVAQHEGRIVVQTEAAPYILGDGVTMGEQAGARIVGFDSGLPLPTSGFKEDVVGFVPQWVVLVNVEGRRFMAETTPYSVSGYLINQQTDAKSWAIFDDSTLKENSDGYFNDPELSRLNVLGVPGWNHATISERVDAGLVLRADNMDDLAKAAGIDSTVLTHTLNRYNSDMERRVDSEFLKADGFVPVRNPPFYAVEVRASLIGVTATGLNINTKSQVLDEYDQVIPGLYAAGELLGCVIGPRYAMGGMSVASAVVFGRLAGKNSALEVGEISNCAV